MSKLATQGCTHCASQIPVNESFCTNCDEAMPPTAENTFEDLEGDVHEDRREGLDFGVELDMELGIEN